MKDLEKNTLLASVSRSFYLTIRALPGPLRRPIGTAYLLARATDTIADTASIPVPERLHHLHLLADCILERNDPAKLVEIGAAICPRQTDQAEKILIAGLFEILEDYQLLDEADRADVRWVLGHIIRGQRNDLEYFNGGLKALPYDAALEEYTWLVAGCVGEFWTRLCARKLPRFARRPEAEMLTLGRDFGKGLQLVNILRDLRADLANGRCYLPLNPGNIWQNPAAPAIYETWLLRAAQLLSSGWDYVLALRGWRLRFACALPILIGLRTLALLKKQTPWQSEERVKVSRREIRGILFQTAWRASSNRLLDAYRKEL